MTEIRELQGLWRRSLLAYPDGRRDTTTAVRWLQGPTRFADLRQPAGLPPCAARGLCELPFETCLRLADQQGFAGCLVEVGGHFEWRRTIDYQPEAAVADAGTLHWDGGILVERGRDVDYLEHWHRAAGGVAPVGALDLEDGASGVRGVLIRVGGHFMFARDRAVVPRRLSTLADCVAAAASLPDAQALVDCEIAFGRVDAGGFRIAHSTLPYRAGDPLEPRVAGDAVTTLDRDGRGGALRRRWRITAAEGDVPPALAG